MAKDELDDLDLDDIGDLEDLDLDDDSLDLDDLDLGDSSDDTDETASGSDDLDLNNDDTLSDLDNDLGDDLGGDLDGDLSLDDDTSLDVDLAFEEDNSSNETESSSDNTGDELDLSSLEDELDLGEDDIVTAPEVEEIKDVGSDDELEKELASLGGESNDDPGDLDLSSDEDMAMGDMGDLDVGSDEDVAMDDADDLDLGSDDDMGDLDLGSDEDMSMDDMGDLDVGSDEEASELDLDSDMALDDTDISDEIDTDNIESADELDTSLEDDSEQAEMGFDIDEPMDSEESELIDNEGALDIDDEALGNAMSVDMDDLEDPLIDAASDDSMVLDESMEVKETDLSDLSESADEIELDDEDIGGMPSLMDEPESDIDSQMDTDLMMSDVDDSTEEVINLDDTPDLNMNNEIADQVSMDGIPEVEEIEDQTELISLEMKDDFSNSESTLIQSKSTTQIEPSSKLIGNELLLKLPHELTVEIGKASLKGEDITSLNYGSIIELDKQVGDPVDIVLGTKIIAKGEVVQINQNKLGIRVTRINF